jgi:hypothetical protein
VEDRSGAGAEGAHTKLTFEAEAKFEGNGGIDEHKDSQKRDALWFFEHASKRWHQTSETGSRTSTTATKAK